MTPNRSINVHLQGFTINVESLTVTVALAPSTTNLRLELVHRHGVTTSCGAEEGKHFLRGYLEHATLTIDELCESAIGYMLLPDGKEEVHRRGLLTFLRKYFCSAFPWHGESELTTQTPAFIMFVAQLFLRLPRTMQGWDAFWAL